MSSACTHSSRRSHATAPSVETEAENRPLGFAGRGQTAGNSKCRVLASWFLPHCELNRAHLAMRIRDRAACSVQVSLLSSLLFSDAAVCRGLQRAAEIACFLWSGAATGHGGQQRYRSKQTFDIFEGTEQIQQLVISRAISGLRIE